MHRPPLKLGRDDFDVDPAEQQDAAARYHEGRGLIGGDPSRRPGHVHWRPIPEEQPYFRLIDVSAAKRARLDAFLADAATPLEVEIGFGSGEFLLGRAAAQGQRRFLGFEVKRFLCVEVIRQAGRAALDNLWISDDDARWALPQLGLAGRVAVLHVLYPDPWWKRRHQVKRLFSLPFAQLVYDLLEPKGVLHVRTDVEGYAALVAEVLAGHGGFTPDTPAWAEPFNADPPTQREAYCRQIDRPFWVLAFGKKQPTTENTEYTEGSD